MGIFGNSLLTLVLLLIELVHRLLGFEIKIITMEGETKCPEILTDDVKDLEVRTDGLVGNLTTQASEIVPDIKEEGAVEGSAQTEVLKNVEETHREGSQGGANQCIPAVQMQNDLPDLVKVENEATSNSNDENSDAKLPQVESLRSLESPSTPMVRQFTQEIQHQQSPAGSQVVRPHHIPKRPRRVVFDPKIQVNLNEGEKHGLKLPKFNGMGTHEIVQRMADRGHILFIDGSLRWVGPTSHHQQQTARHWWSMIDEDEDTDDDMTLGGPVDFYSPMAVTLVDTPKWRYRQKNKSKSRIGRDGKASRAVEC